MRQAESATHTFICGPCGTTVTGITSLTKHTLMAVMEAHAKVCPGYAPNPIGLSSAPLPAATPEETP